MKPEAALHRAVAGYLRAALKPPTIWTAFPAGGGGRIRGAQLKAMGLQKGWPDLIVMHEAPKGGPIVLGIELKAKGGRVSPEQRGIMQGFHAIRAWYVLCRSVEEVENACRYVGIPLHASVMGRAA